MDEQIKNHLLEYLDKTAGAVEKLVDFSADQIPLVAKEVLTYNIWSNSFSILVNGFFLYKITTSCIAMFSKENDRVNELKTSKNSHYSYESEFSFIVAVAVFVSLLVGFFLLVDLFHTTDSLIKATIAPRLFLLDYLRGLK